ncbi:MAG: glutathione S-transferase family protein, partial [Deltaproteobacteria bacterium]|nr:glutathione S-transferase family protein [Deltaproteobacteria bacterium]
RKSLIEYSGQRKVPVMDYNGQCTIDSTYISALLEEKYPQPSIYPSQPSDRGLCLMLEDWADEDLNRAVLMVRRAETPEARQPAEKELAVHLRSLDLLFEGKKFIFDRMTLADIAIFTQLHYLYTVAKYEVPNEYKNLHGWMDLMRQALKLPSLYDVAA